MLYKRTKWKFYKLKILQIKNTMDELNNRMIMTETRLSELKVVNQSKERRRKSKRKGQSFRNLGDNNKKFNAHNWSS